MIDWLIDYDGWDWRLRTAAIIGLMFIPRVKVSGEPWSWWCRLGITPDLYSYKAQQRHLVRVEGMDEGMRIYRIQYLWYVNGYLTYRKILRRGNSGFTSHPKEGVLRIVNKDPSPWPCLNPRPLGPVASTLTTAPPRRLCTPYVELNTTWTRFHVYFLVFFSVPPGQCKGIL
jgi:hypothetical protein